MEKLCKNYDRKTFMLLLEKDFPEMTSTRYEKNEDFFVRTFSDPDMMKQVMDSVGTVLYERLKKKDYNVELDSQLSMIAKGKLEYK